MKCFSLMIVGSVALSSCHSLKLGKNNAEEAANPYGDEAGWEGNTVADNNFAGADNATAYNQVYNSGAWHDDVQVVPFTDNGSDPTPMSEVSSSRASSKASSPRAAIKPAVASRSRSPKNKDGSVAKKSAGLAAAGRATSGSSSAKVKNSHRTHTVKSGDTLYGISRSYRVSVDGLKRRNQLASDMIRVGEELAID